MFRKLVIISFMLCLVGSVSAYKYVGDPNSTNGWDTTSAVTSVDPTTAGKPYTDTAINDTFWTTANEVDLVNGNGLDPSNHLRHSVASLTLTPVDWTPCRMLINMTFSTNYPAARDANQYDSDMTASGMAWFGFEFDQTYYIGDMLIWNYNPDPCEDRDAKDRWCANSITVSYSTDANTWNEDITTILQKGPMEGWNWPGDDAYYPEYIAIDANARYVIVTVNTNHSTLGPPQTSSTMRVGMSEVHFERDPNRATGPSPADGGDKYTNVALSWVPGFDTANTVYHKLYLSTVKADVDARTASSVTLSYATTTYDPGVADGITYYWAIDELDSGSSVIGEGTGDTWSFYSRSCVAGTEPTLANGNMNGDCSINFKDFALLADKYLVTGLWPPN